MNELTPATIRTMPGRELIALAVADLDRDAEAGRRAVERYGAESVATSLLVSGGLADALRFVLSRGSIRLEDRPQKDGSPTWSSKLRHEADGEFARQFAECIRSALLANYAVPPNAAENLTGSMTSAAVEPVEAA